MTVNDPKALSWFAELGQRVTAQWAAADRDPDRFADIAAQALSDTPPSQAISFEDLVRDLLSAEDPPPQDLKFLGFSDLPVTVFDGDGFVVQALVWLEGSTAIHDHGFSGAFTLLQGRSVQTRWAFEIGERIDDRFDLGALRRDGLDVLSVGDVVQISPGPSFIHSVFHLPRPTVSVVVRTRRDFRHGLQRMYLPPGLSLVDPPDRPAGDPIRNLVGTLAGFGPAWESVLGDHAASLADDPARLCLLLDTLVLRRSELGLADDLLQACAPRLGHLVEPIRQALEESLRIGTLTGLRDRAQDEDERLFLAALLNAQDRATALGIIGALHPDDDPLARAVAASQALAPRALDLPDAPETALTCEVLIGGGDERELLRRAAADGLDATAVVRSMLVLESSLSLGTLLR